MFGGVPRTVVATLARAMTEVIPTQSFTPRPGTGAFAFLLGLLVVGAGVWLLVVRGEQAVGWVAIGFGVFFALWFGQALWRRVPIVQVSDTGVWARLPGFGVVPFADIDSIRLVHARGQAFLAIQRGAGARDGTRRSLLLQQLATLAGADDLVVPVKGLSATPEQIVRVVELAWEHARTRG